MMVLPKKLSDKLEKRDQNQSLRELPKQNDLVDFLSNDYLGLSSSNVVFERVHEFLLEMDIQQNGATGSRLISGNHALYEQVEEFLCEFHESEAALIFNSGYDANVGFFSSVPQKGDIILYDELAHASIRDGIRMSSAKAYKFKHNNLEDLSRLLQKFDGHTEIYVVTESVFSMDGDCPDLEKMAELTIQYKAHLVVDEAHAVGVFGEKGVGLVQDLKLQNKIFARVITFGKALGCHGAAVLGSKELKQYLVNFARSFIYTTSLPPHSLATILLSYQEMMHSNRQLELRNTIQFFKEQLHKTELSDRFIPSNSAIQGCIIPGNERVKTIAKEIQEQGFDVKAILSPTVPEGEERIRFCIHSYNSQEEITNVLQTLRIFVS